MISRTREQTAAAEPRADRTEADGTGQGEGSPAGADAALEALYVRHTPDVDRSDGYRPALAAAARSHRRLARHRSPGQELIRVGPAGAEPTPGPDHPRPGPEQPGPQPEQPEAEQPEPGAVVEIITDDMPYLVESVLAAVRRAGSEVRRVIHPIVVVERGPDGELRDVLTDADPAAPPSGALAESWIHVDLVGPAQAGLDADLAGVLRDVREVVHDAPAMARQAVGVGDRLLADGLLGGADGAGGPLARAGRREPAALARRRALHVPRAPLPRPPRAVGSCRRVAGWACSATPAVPSRSWARSRRPRNGRSIPTWSPDRRTCSCSPGPARRAACCGPFSPTTWLSGSSTAPGGSSASTGSSACSPSPRSTRTCSTSRWWSGTCGRRSTGPGSRWSPTRGSRCSR